MKKYGIIAFGSGACNSLSKLEKSDLYDRIAIDVNAEDLSHSDSDIKIQIGKNLCNGLGCGGNPVVGTKALVENIEEVLNLIKNYEQILIIACLGGGCATGCITELAQYLKENYLMILTMPFSFEGKRRMQQATEAIEELDRLNINKLIIRNNSLLPLINKKCTFKEAFEIVDEKIMEEVKKIILA